MTLVPAPGFDSATGHIELGRIPGPFTVTVTADGREVYEPIATIAGLPPHATYVAWAAPPTMYPVQKLGIVTNGRTRLRPFGLDRFVVVITAERSAAVIAPTGPPVLRGQSPSSRLVPADFVQFALGAAKDSTAMMMDMAPDTTGWTTVPMPAGIAMLPAEMALRPAVAPMLPRRGGSEPARPSAVVRLAAGDTLRLAAGLVTRRIGQDTLTMYAYNGQIPGPLIEVRQGDEIVVDFANHLDRPTSVHWHGIRLDNRFDGVDPVGPGEHFVYRVRFPDAGLYWYHPHVREDTQQNLGLYGNILVRPRDAGRPAPREARLIVNDLLLTDDGLVPYGQSAATHALMGRFGNVLLANSERGMRLTVRRGEVVQFLLTNVANARVFNLSFPGARLKVIGSDAGAFEREVWVPSVVIAPAERYIVQVRFDRPGHVPLVNHVQGLDHLFGRFVPFTDTLAIVDVRSRRAPGGADFDVLHERPAVIAGIERYRRYFARPPDRTLVLTLETHDLPFVTRALMRLDSSYFAPVEWAESMPNMNWASTTDQIRWVLRDPATGKENMDIGWTFARDTAIVVRLVNDRQALHGMQHPIHVHGQRFLVLAVNGVPNQNLVWKDTVLVPAGAAVDILLELSNPGRWMLHCHTAEHLTAQMMTSFTVQ
jgi:FtsP/CotA-like multicopper oxidase with cupredoxin domain